MRFKGFNSGIFDMGLQHGVGVVFDYRGKQWRHAVRVFNKSSPAVVVAALRALADAIEKKFDKPSNEWVDK